VIGTVVVRPVPDGPFVVRLYPDSPVGGARCSGVPEGIFVTTAALKMLLGLGALLLGVPVTLPGVSTFYGAPSIKSLRPGRLQQRDQPGRQRQSGKYQIPHVVFLLLHGLSLIYLSRGGRVDRWTHRRVKENPPYE
jgi:hypothetical protein